MYKSLQMQDDKNKLHYIITLLQIFVILNFIF